MVKLTHKIVVTANSDNTHETEDNRLQLLKIKLEQRIWMKNIGLGMKKLRKPRGK